MYSNQHVTEKQKHHISHHALGRTLELLEHLVGKYGYDEEGHNVL